MALNLPERCSVLSYAEEVEADITAKMLSVEVEGKSTSNFQGIVPLSTEYKQHDLYRKVHVWWFRAVYYWAGDGRAVELDRQTRT